MSEKKLDVEEQKRKTRRKLLKLAAYSIPAVSSILAAGDAYANGDDDDDDGGGGGSGSGDDERAGTGIKTKRKKPNGPKKYKKGVS